MLVINFIISIIFNWYHAGSTKILLLPASQEVMVHLKEQTRKEGCPVQHVWWMPRVERRTVSRKKGFLSRESVGRRRGKEKQRVGGKS